MPRSYSGKVSTYVTEGLHPTGMCFQLWGLEVTWGVRGGLGLGFRLGFGFRV